MTKRKRTTHIIVHCSATPAGSVESFRGYHVQYRGWQDIGYHWVIGNGHGMPDGQIEPGRAEDLVGAHCTGYNDKSIGICIVGDTDKIPPTKAQYEQLIAKLVQLCRTYQIPAENIIGHREAPSGAAQGKTCPGRLVDMDQIRAIVAKGLEEQ